MISREQLSRLYAEHLDELDRRYAPVLARAGFDAVVVHSGSLLKRSGFDDQYWPLRPTPYFQHFVPLSESDCALVIRPGRRPLLVHVAQSSFWEKPAAPESDHFREALEVIEVASVEAIQGQLPSASGRLAFVGDDTTRASMWSIASEAHNPASLVGEMDKQRATKTPYEVLCLAEANRRAALGHHAVRKLFLDGDLSELELHLAYLRATSQDDPETPYKNIVALCENGATLHHIAYEKRARQQSGQSLLLDAGATFLGYASDITRTWVKGRGEAATTFAQLVDGVEQMQKRLCAAVRVGLPYEELHDESHRQVSAILRDIGLVRLSAEEIDASGISRAFYPHGLGHSLGLQCHDVGCAQLKPRADNPFLRNTSTIVEGQVFTVEPGVYFIDGLLAPLRQGPRAGDIDWKLVDALAPLGGVRIEDDLHVIGGEAMTRNITRERLPVGGGRID